MRRPLRQHCGSNVVSAARLSVVVARKIWDGFECPTLTVSAFCTCKGQENAAVKQGGKTIKRREEDVATLMILAFTIMLPFEHFCLHEGVLQIAEIFRSVRCHKSL